MAGMSSSTALVTGATGGIGLHIARQLAERGGRFSSALAMRSAARRLPASSAVVL
jgi:NAD(P)-dependent dehydrogenase (short-subunit alcohol dehydrogenase family)